MCLAAIDRMDGGQIDGNIIKVEVKNVIKEKDTKKDENKDTAKKGYSTSMSCRDQQVTHTSGDDRRPAARGRDDRKKSRSRSRGFCLTPHRSLIDPYITHTACAPVLRHPCCGS